MKPRPPPPAQPALCISIHDVAPATWPACAQLIAAVRAVQAVPLTLLVVPAYHRLPVRDPVAYDAQLEHALSRGDELALHGYVHLDEAAPATTLRARYLREVFTQKEGEFSALGADEARQRIDLGLQWFARRGWPLAGFVAPAWLMGKGSWSALREYPFRYTSTMHHLHLLREHHVLHAPTLVYTARNAAGRLASRWWNDLLAHRLTRSPLLRLALHPADAQHPLLMRHLQCLLTRLLLHRTAMTKRDFCDHWSSTCRASV